MSSFLDKLKKGMGLKDLIQDLDEEKKTRESLPLRQPVRQELKAEKKKRIKKIEKVKEAKKIEGKKEEEKMLKEEKPPKTEILPEPKEKRIEVKEEKKEPEEKQTGIKKEVGWFEPEGELAVDLYQTDREIIIQSAIAGVKPEELDIAIENDVVTIKGEREKPFEKEIKNYFYQECYWGHFSRKIILPAEVDASRTEASMREGVLTIRIPKIERERKRKIVIEK